MLHVEYYSKRDSVNVMDWERRLGSHIRALGDEDVSAILEMDPIPEIEAELSYDWSEVLEDCEIPSGARVLEVGAGFGQLTYELLQLGAEVTVVEPSMYRARVLSDRFASRDLEVYVGLLCDMHFSQQFDVVLVHDIPRGLGMRLPLQGMVEHHLKVAEQFLAEDGEIYVLLDREADYLDADAFGGLEVEGRVLPIDADHALIDRVLEVQVDLLRKLQDVCDAHGLQTYLMYGSLLGAVRHGGAIPGDDDIDVAMPRADYDKLMALSSAFDGKYFLQTPSNDNAFYGGYLKLHDRETTCLRAEHWNVDPCEGISIDIFPLDVTYADEAREEKKCKKLRLYQRMLFAYSYGYSRRFRDMPLLKWKFYKYLGKLTTKERIIEKMHQVMTSGDKKSKNYGIYTHYPANGAARYVPAKAFEERRTLSYEGLMLDAPSGWDEVLIHLYGWEYHRPYEWNPWKRRHGFYDVEHPYGYYKEKFTRLFRGGCRDKEVVLLGDACMFDQFERFAPWAKITARVQIPDDAIAFGLVPEVSDDKKFPNPITDYADWTLPDENTTQVVIVAINLRQAEQYALQAGSKDYVFYTLDHTDMLMADPECLWYREEERFHA